MSSSSSSRSFPEAKASTASQSARLDRLEAETQVLLDQMKADLQIQTDRRTRVVELEGEIREIREQLARENKDRGLYGRLVTIRQLQEHCPLNVRNLIRHAETNGLSAALIRANGRILIDTDRFNDWLESKRES